MNLHLQYLHSPSSHNDFYLGFKIVFLNIQLFVETCVVIGFRTRAVNRCPSRWQSWGTEHRICLSCFKLQFL